MLVLNTRHAALRQANFVGQPHSVGVYMEKLKPIPETCKKRLRDVCGWIFIYTILWRNGFAALT